MCEGSPRTRVPPCRAVGRTADGLAEGGSGMHKPGSTTSAAVAVLTAMLVFAAPGTPFASGAGPTARPAGGPETAGDRVADAVLGQSDFTSGQCNQGGESASTLCEPMTV